ncbi:MAG: nuclear transport factor 2 family protein [Ewingella sp.]|uniref:nuclear transport factor 2 family protein n=1 Tax=Ewingella TaxID=41201 RepID=UPI0017C73E3D|nr:nuclear transport factor 2 family protein [Pseudomonas reactans]
MSNTLQDRQDIADLMTGWIHRDLAEWDQLLELFHDDGIIEVTWFEGLFSEFVKGSQKMGNSGFSTKHVIGSPVITFNGDRAIVETNAIIIGENASLGLGCNGHNRFYDLVEKRDGVWRIVKRQSIYDMGNFTFPVGVVDIDQATVEKYPREYAALAYLLEKSGFPVKRVFATKFSQQEQEMKAKGKQWLAEAKE